MEDRPSDPDAGAPGFDIDPTTANPARLHNYFAGGDANFTADREAAHYVSEKVPGGVETARANVRAMTDFLVRAVRYVVEQGVRQFLAVGVPVPSDDDIHVVAQKDAPESRVVYVGNDPLVLAHAHALRRSHPEGATAYIHGSLYDAGRILADAGDILDLTQPVAVVLPATLNLIPDERDPYGVVERLVGGVPSGSYLIVTHSTNDMEVEGMAETARRLVEALGSAYVVRRHDEVLRFFTGLDLLDPGLVQVDQWRPGARPPLPEPERRIPNYAGVARKP